MLRFRTARSFDGPDQGERMPSGFLDAVNRHRKTSGRKESMRLSRMSTRASIGLLLALLSSAPVRAQISKADQAKIASWPVTMESVNRFMTFEKGFGALKASEPGLAEAGGMDMEKRIRTMSAIPAAVKLAGGSVANVADVVWTGAALHTLMARMDPKRARVFTSGQAMEPSPQQMAFAEAHRADLVRWRQELVEIGKAQTAKYGS